MLGRSYIFAALVAIALCFGAGAEDARASSTAGLPDGSALHAVLAKASDTLRQANIEVPDEVSERDVLMLALNVYFEARGEGISGKAAVAHVTLNRLKDDRWPKTLSEVILQPGQFSWTRKPPKIEDREALKASIMVAMRALEGSLRDRTGGALYFHAARLGDPAWTQGLTRIAQIGSHTFYAD